MDSKFKGKIIVALRRLSYTWPPRNEIKKRAKVDLCTFQCSHCLNYIYDGSSEATFKKVLLRHSRLVRQGKVCVDHKEPVVPINGFKTGIWNWDEFIERLYCDISMLQVLCKECHDAKSSTEKDERKVVRKSRKT